MNFKIINVNGRDLTGATHEEVAKAFEKASEPITVVLTKNQVPPSELSKFSPGKCNISTQTSKDFCYCECNHANYQNIHSPLQDTIMSELLKDQRNRHSLYNHAPIANTFTIDSYDESFYQFEYEEVSINRPSESKKLGITLLDCIDKTGGQIQVVVTHVSPGSLAHQSKKIQEGDQIIKIDGVYVDSMKHAAQLLSNEKSVVTFLIGRSHFLTDNISFSGDVQSEFQFHDLLFDDVDPACNSGRLQSMQCSDTKTEKTESQEAKFLEVESKLNETTESYLSKSAESQSTKDSGMGHTLQSSIQDDPLEAGSGISIENEHQYKIENYAQLDNGACSLAKEFTYLQPKEYNFKKQVSFLKSPTFESDLASQDKHIPFFNGKSVQLHNLTKAIEDFQVSDENDYEVFNRCRLSSMEEYDDLNDIASPWVQIARQDYEEKLKQMKTDTFFRRLHPPMTDTPCVKSELTSGKAFSQQNDTTDNTSSAYSTGDSFRSTRSDSPSRSNKLVKKDNFPKESKAKRKKRNGDVTITYNVHTNANVNGDANECYLTHCEESDSEGFEDANFEVMPLPVSRPIPFPRILHPPHEAITFLGDSLTASTRNLCKAAAAAARNRRHASNKVLRSPDVEQENLKNKFSKNGNPGSHHISTFNTNKETSNCKVSCISTSAADCVTGRSSQVIYDDTDVSKDSTSLDQPYLNSNEVEIEKQNSKENVEDIRLEWKVRVSRDGTRYITKRPVRERLLRQREKRLLAERCGITTDDDLTEMKLGRHWSREERKRQIRHAREKKRRREFMERCRLDVLNETPPADNDIVQLRQKKLSKHKQKRMILDNFVSVQELVAHGDRTIKVDSANPLLSVTYI